MKMCRVPEWRFQKKMPIGNNPAAFPGLKVFNF